jgi:hypothetical protein
MLGVAAWCSQICHVMFCIWQQSELAKQFGNSCRFVHRTTAYAGDDDTWMSPNK